MVMHRSGEGDSFSSIQKRLNEVPSDLNGLYRHILENLIGSQNRPKAFLLMQWVAFAERPLSMEEIFHAMASDNGSVFGHDELFVHGEDPAVAVRRMKALINSLSGALIEVKLLLNEGHILMPRNDRGELVLRSGTQTWRRTVNERRELTVQFIHESVRGFLLKHGLRFLRGISSDDKIETIIGESHNRLLASCIEYMKSPEIITRAYLIEKESRDIWRELHGNPRVWGNSRRHTTEEECPFLDYASKEWISHAKKTESHGILPDDLAKQFGLPNRDILVNWWRIFYKLHPSFSATFKLLYRNLLSVTNGPALTHVARFLLQNSIFPPRKFFDEDSKNAPDGCLDGVPLLQAVHWHHKQLVSCLVDGANQAVDEPAAYGHTGISAVEFAAYYGLKEILEILLLSRKRQQLIKMPPPRAKFDEKSFQLVVRLLLGWGRCIESDIHDIRRRFPSKSRTPKLGGQKTFLLDFRGFYPGSSAHSIFERRGIGSALRSAVSLGDLRSTRLLLDWGANPNASSGECGTALMDAASSGDQSYKMVQLLIEYGADVNGGCQKHAGRNTRPGEEWVVWHTPLQYAASKGCLGKDIVNLLVHHGADLDAFDRETGNTALHAAVSAGESEEEVVKFLINRGANVNTPSGHLLGHAVKVAEKGNVVELLLKSDAVINNEASYAYFAHAPWSPYLYRGGRDCLPTCPLKVAAARGDSCKHLVQMLLSWGANANAYEPYDENIHSVYEFYRSPLGAALRNGDDAKEVLRLLLDAGANFDVVDQGRAFSGGIGPNKPNSSGMRLHSPSQVEQTSQVNHPLHPSSELHSIRKYDHIDVLSWVLAPITKGKKVHDTVHFLRTFGICLRFDGISKPSVGEWGLEWLIKEMDQKAQLDLFETTGLFNHIEDKDMVKKGAISAIGWNPEELQAALLEMTENEMEIAFLNHGYEDYVEPGNTIWYGPQIKGRVLKKLHLKCGCNRKDRNRR